MIISLEAKPWGSYICISCFLNPSNSKQSTSDSKEKNRRAIAKA